MPRQPRIEYPRAYYHVMCRGDRREAIFHGDADRKCFLETLEEVCARTGWRVHAWVLMDNHYHWLLETPEANLVDGMKWFQNTYTRRFNSANRLWGHVFGGRYKSIVVEPGDYHQRLVDYIHLNPARASLVETSCAEDLLSYSWSSLTEHYMQSPSKRPDWINVSTRLEVAPKQERARHRKQYLNYLYGITLEEGTKAGKGLPHGQGQQSTLSRGWYWGSQEFREKLEEIFRRGNEKNREPAKSGNQQTSTPKHGLDEALRLISEGMKALEISDKEIRQTKGSFAPKVVIATAVHQKTTASQSWIAGKLSMKSAINVSQQIGRLKRGEIKMSKRERKWLNSVNIST
jgi:putative transposase